MLDIVMLSYKEPKAEETWINLKTRFPWAKRVDGVKGIMNAHKAAAELCSTYAFYVVDADAKIYPDFDFSYPLFKDNELLDRVAVWRCRNSVNGLVYGYGGLKLFPRKIVLDFNESIIDFATTVSGGIKIMPEVASETTFNTSPFDSWKSAFRECTKLSSKVINNQKDKETEERLNVWCAIGADKPFGKECIQGAIAGRKYGSNNIGDMEALAKINDFAWLKEKFNE